MSLLSEYESRTGKWKYIPIQEDFHTDSRLVNKVNPDGSYAPFYGSTVVFIADEICIQAAQEMQAALHNEVGDLLASPLPASTFHMTLHDLISPEKCVSDPADADGFRREVDESFQRAETIVNEIRSGYQGRKIIMDADRVVRMVSKSMVLMLRPHSEADFELLNELYKLFDCIVDLNRPLTPHITLAYLKPGMIDGKRLGSAVDRIQIQKDNAPSFVFGVESLTAQLFYDMQTYV